ncbi:MAG: DUF1828 domain-containing protein [Candidatus Cloacimonetes bacterium]|nr:DUF1828 domain-containing protein [Candidatus Cloacimonadota bacterium]
MDFQKLIATYTSWFSAEFSYAQYSDYYELTTPFLDRFCDCIQVYIKQEADGLITITDDSYVINNLIASGFKLKPKSKRKQMIERLIRIYDLQLDGNAIKVTTTISDFPKRLHHLFQALLAIDDMFENIVENPKDFFIEDVLAFFKEKFFVYEKDFPLIGKTGSKYKYDFYFPKNSTKPDRFCKIFSKITKQKRDMVIFNWLDTQETRNNKLKSSELYVLLNNINIANMEDIAALKNYDIKTICFSDKNEVVKIFGEN